MIPEIKNFKNYLSDIILPDDASFESAHEYLHVEKICKGGFFVREGQICPVQGSETARQIVHRVISDFQVHLIKVIQQNFLTVSPVFW